MRKNPSKIIIGHPPIGDFIRQPHGTVGYYRTPSLRKFQHAVGAHAMRAGGRVSFRTLYGVDPHTMMDAPVVEMIVEVTVVEEAHPRKKRSPHGPRAAKRKT